MFSWLRPTKSGQYRIKRRFGGYEPQMSYTAGMVKGIFWFPLDTNGYWLEPDAFTYGNITRHIVMSKHDAKQVILRARATNEQHIKLA